MSKSLVLKLLEAVPPQDLEGLKSICIRTVPTKPIKKLERCWGGLMGLKLHSDDKGISGIRIFLYSITKQVLRQFTYGNSNLYDSFIEKFASVLYHELGHHVHSKDDEYYILTAQRKKNEQKLQKLRKTKDDDRFKIQKELVSINNKVESFANEYETKIISISRSMNLLEAPQPKDILFFKIMRDRYIDSMFHSLDVFRKEGERSHSWPSMLAVFDHLRKCGLRNGVKYNLREIFVKIYERKPDRNELRRFKRFVLKHMEPFWYVSRTGMKYAYFTEAHMSDVKRLCVMHTYPGVPVIEEEYEHENSVGKGLAVIDYPPTGV